MPLPQVDEHSHPAKCRVLSGSCCPQRRQCVTAEVSIPCPPVPRRWSLYRAAWPCWALSHSWWRHIAQHPWRPPVLGDVKAQRCQEPDVVIQS